MMKIQGVLTYCAYYDRHNNVDHIDQTEPKRIRKNFY